MSNGDMCDFLAGLRSQITRLADEGRATIGLATELHELADDITVKLKAVPLTIVDKLAEPDFAKRCLLRASLAAPLSEADDWREAAALAQRAAGDHPIAEPPPPLDPRTEALALHSCWLNAVLATGPLPRSTANELITRIMAAAEPIATPDLPAASNASHHSG